MTPLWTALTIPFMTKPWTVTTNARRTLGTELFEFACNENEKSTAHMGPHIK